MTDDASKVETLEEWAARVADEHTEKVDERRAKELDFIASMTAHALWSMPVGYGGGLNPFDMQPRSFFMSDGGRKALAFGRANGWPPAEAFAREGVFGVSWSADAWANDCFYRLGVEMSVGALKAFDQAHKELDVIRRERTAGLPLPTLILEDHEIRFDPETREMSVFTHDEELVVIKPGAPGSSTPLSAVKGIGDKLEARLHAVGVQSVEALAELSAAGDDEGPAGDEARLQAIKDADADLFERLSALILSARKHLHAQP